MDGVLNPVSIGEWLRLWVPVEARIGLFPCNCNKQFMLSTAIDNSPPLCKIVITYSNQKNTTQHKNKTIHGPTSISDHLPPFLYVVSCAEHPSGHFCMGFPVVATMADASALLMLHVFPWHQITFSISKFAQQSTKPARGWLKIYVILKLVDCWLINYISLL